MMNTNDLVRVILACNGLEYHPELPPLWTWTARSPGNGLLWFDKVNHYLLVSGESGVYLSSLHDYLGAQSYEDACQSYERIFGVEPPVVRSSSEDGLWAALVLTRWPKEATDVCDRADEAAFVLQEWCPWFSDVSVDDYFLRYTFKHGDKEHARQTLLTDLLEIDPYEIGDDPELATRFILDLIEASYRDTRS